MLCTCTVIHRHMSVYTCTSLLVLWSLWCHLVGFLPYSFLLLPILAFLFPPPPLTPSPLSPLSLLTPSPPSPAHSYVKGLTLLDRDFRSAVQSANRAHDKPIVSEETLKLILGNVSSLLSLNSDMLAELEGRMKNW